jgi:hypothetical protein
MDVISTALFLEDDATGSSRIEPLVFSRLAGGGKTTILRAPLCYDIDRQQNKEKFLKNVID